MLGRPTSVLVEGMQFFQHKLSCSSGHLSLSNVTFLMMVLNFFFSSMATSASGSDGAGGDRPPYHHTLLEGNCDLILILLEANCHLIFFVEIFE